MTIGRDIEAQLERLSPEQRAKLLQQLARTRRDSALIARGTLPAPLSPGQRNLWVMNEVEAQPYKYNMASAYVLRGALQPEMLRRAFELITERHRILRARFVQSAQGPLQEELADFQLPLPLLDLSTLAPELQHERLRELLAAEGRWSFDLAQGPLLRLHLYRLGDSEHVLHLNVHHAIFDGWSKALLFHELELAYDALLHGRPVELPELPVQFADFAHWQNLALATELQGQLRYWVETLAGAPALLELPADFARPPATSSEGALLELRVEPTLFAALRELATRSGATIFMTVLAAFNAALQRFTGCDDISIATPVDNRNRQELRALIGYFLNTVVLRTRVAPELSFRQLLGAVKQTALAAFRHQDVPFEQVVDAVAPLRSASYSPLNQVAFVFQHSGGGGLRLEGLTTEKIVAGNGTTKYDLYATFREVDQGLSGWLTYRKDLFRAATVESFAACLLQLLQEAVAAPDRPLAQLALLDQGRLAEAVMQGRGVATSVAECSLHAAFARRAALCPGCVAVRDAHEQLTCAELEASAAQLAAVLEQRGVRPGTVVGVHARRSAWYVQALLAVWKCGAAVVPLDTHQPAERLAAILEQVQPVLVLHDSAQTPSFAGNHHTLGRAAAEAVASSGLRCVYDAGPEDMAFVLFTSGSSGIPKGVIGTHGGVLNRIQVYGARSGEVVAQRTNIGFVDSFTEICGTLAAGATLVVLDDEVVRDPFELVDALAEHSVTLLHIVPSLMRAVLDEFPQLQARLPRLERVVFSGEALAAGLVNRMRQCLPHTAIVNVYGATEAADVSACEVLELLQRPRVPIGRALPNMSLQVLDTALTLCPVGVHGDLYAGGPSLALGYWNDARLTAMRFVPDPTSPTPGARMYALGDRGRRLADGNVEFLGRRDTQVSLHGLRIELSEIERVLEKLEGVSQACVVSVPAAETDALVAHVELQSQARIDVPMVRRHLRKSLPDYMNPSAVVLCAGLPHNVSGKVDREALRARGLPPASHDHIAPRTPTEQRLAAIWCEVLRLEQVSVTAAFFDLGGQSLLAMRIVARIRAEFGIRLGAQQLFELLTIESIAQQLDSLPGAAVRDEQPAQADVEVEIQDF